MYKDYGIMHKMRIFSTDWGLNQIVDFLQKISEGFCLSWMLLFVIIIGILLVLFLSSHSGTMARIEVLVYMRHMRNKGAVYALTS